MSAMLHIDSSSTQQTHYDVLSVKEDATYDQIRSNYKAAILDYHPDKLQTKTNTTVVEDKFLSVQKAWEVLSDSLLRARYDKELRASRREVDVAADEIKLDEMSVEDLDDSREFYYECRCGDYFTVSGAELEKMGIPLCENGAVKPCLGDIFPTSVLLPCGSCSLKIRVAILGIKNSKMYEYAQEMECILSTPKKQPNVGGGDGSGYFGVESSFCSVKSSFSSYSKEMNPLEDIQKLSDCKGWPFGLFRGSREPPPPIKSPFWTVGLG